MAHVYSTIEPSSPEEAIIVICQRFPPTGRYSLTFQGDSILSNVSVTLATLDNLSAIGQTIMEYVHYQVVAA